MSKPPPIRYQAPRPFGLIQCLPRAGALPIRRARAAALRIRRLIGRDADVRVDPQVDDGMVPRLEPLEIVELLWPVPAALVGARSWLYLSSGLLVGLRYSHIYILRLYPCVVLQFSIYRTYTCHIATSDGWKTRR